MTQIPNPVVLAEIPLNPSAKMRVGQAFLKGGNVKFLSVVLGKNVKHQL